MNGDIIKAEHIRKKYGGKTVLRDVSLHVKQGEIYGLIEKNGSGKTTLLRILTGPSSSRLPSARRNTSICSLNGAFFLVLYKRQKTKMPPEGLATKTF